METLDIKSISQLKQENEALAVLLDLIDAGRLEGSFYLNSIKTAIEVNDNILRAAKALLETDVKLFRGYDRHVAAYVSMFSR